MADAPAIPAIVPNLIKPKSNTGKWIFWIVVFLLLIYAIYWLFFKIQIDRKKLNGFISKAAAPYVNPQQAEIILAQGADEILTDMQQLRQAKTFADSTNVPIEQVISDNSVAMARMFGYLQ